MRRAAGSNPAAVWGALAPYVKLVVAVGLGAPFPAEAITPRMLLARLAFVASVALIVSGSEPAEDAATLAA